MRRVFKRAMIRVASAAVVLALGVPPAGADGTRKPRQVLIIFEDAAPPCLFPETTALRDRYAPQGVTFAGPEENDGGAILRDCSKFGIEGYGGYNFLAFNGAAKLEDGGTPRGPETLSFSRPVGEVEILAGSPVEGTVTLSCFDEDGVPKGSASITMTKVLQPLSVSGQDIVTCQIEFDAVALVLDNLRFTPMEAAPIPAESPLGAGLLVLLLALAGAALLRRP